MTRPQYGKPETWLQHRIYEPEDSILVEKRGRRWWVVETKGWIRMQSGPYWRRSTAEKVRHRWAGKEDR